jgi:hypothetical protein
MIIKNLLTDVIKVLLNTIHSGYPSPSMRKFGKQHQQPTTGNRKMLIFGKNRSLWD